jgi:alpha-galactosidase
MTYHNLKCFLMNSITMILAGAAFSLPAGAAETVSLSELDLGKDKVRQEWAQPQIDKSVDGYPLTIGGKKFEHGLGTHANSTLYIDLKGGAQRFTAFVGIDDDVKKSTESSAVFHVIGDGRELWKSDVMKAGHQPKKVDVNLKGVKTLLLMVGDAGDGFAFDHADWADARIEYAGERPATIAPPSEEPVILTPPPPLTPRINGAGVFGVRPGSPFLFTIPATGRRPIVFSADNLPEGLRLDPQTGQITGSIQNRGEYMVILKAKNGLGRTQRELKIVCGDTIALTPPMGWSSRLCFARTVDDAKIRATADAMVRSGLIDHGWTYINIEEGWMTQSDGGDVSLPGDARDDKDGANPDVKFPDMTALCAYIHDKGLKAGIAAPRARYAVDNPAETRRKQEKDIQRFAQWGFDYYKFNWGTYMQVNREKGLPGLKEIYQSLKTTLNKSRRDMVFSIYAPSLFRAMGEEIGGNCWLATADISDSWPNVSNIGFSQAGQEQAAKPGHWDNADLLMVGTLGWRNPRPTRLTPNEQYAQVSLWCLLCSPLILGCDLTKLDEFTLNLLTNDEVLAVNQDPLGVQARRVSQAKEVEVWVKELDDGSLAAGLFNRGEVEKKVVVNWSDLGLTDKQIVRDLWRQKDLGECETQFTAAVGRHGALLIRLRPSGK